MTYSENDVLQKTAGRHEGAVYPSLRNKRVIVTGGGSGIGAGLVEAFVAQGAKVAFVDVAQADSHALVERLTGGADHAPSFHPLDLTDLDALNTTFATMIDQLGGVDILLNNAANDDRHTVDEITAEYWDQRMNVNLRHVFFAAQAVVPSMKAAGGGAIVNFGSISWHLALKELILYQTAKAAIEGLTRSLARDLALALGTVGHVAALRRTRAGPFTLDEAISLDKLAALLQAGDEQAILPLTAGLDDIPALPVTPEDATLLRSGRTLPGHPASHGLYLATDGPVPVALVEVSSTVVRVVRGFNLV